MFGSFFLITLPLLAAEETKLFAGWRLPPLAIYAALLGMSHFLVTFLVYLNRANLEHFGRGWKNRFLYFGVPVLILAVIGIVYGKRGFERGTGTVALVTFLFFLFLRGIDLYHVVRQSFGVFEMTKSQVGLTYAPWAKHLARAFFMAMFLVQFHTASNGKTFHADAISVPVAAVAAVLFVALMAVLIARFNDSAPEDRSYALVPVAYLTVQGICAILVAYKSVFYVASLAIHYVEYHLLMKPRIFANLDEKAKVDRIMLWFGSRKVLFYGLLIGVSLVIALLPSAANGFEYPGGAHGWIYWLFVVQGTVALLHFYVDALLWRFSNPFYRKTLGPLYYGGK